jgi:hypothetical protein
VAVVLTLAQRKQIRINIHKRNNTNTQYKQYKTHSTQVHILPKHPQNGQNTPNMASSRTYENEVTGGVYFLSAVLGDPSMNDSMLMIILFVVCLSVCVCPLVSTVSARNLSEFTLSSDAQFCFDSKC